MDTASLGVAGFPGTCTGTENLAGDADRALYKAKEEGRNCVGLAVIRTKLIEENLLDAVVGLPANLFTTTGIPVAILVLDRSREAGGVNEARKNVHFIDASKEFTQGKTQDIMNGEHIGMIFDTFRNDPPA